MVTLVTPDVHEKIKRLQDIIKAYSGVDKVVILGDFFDSYAGLTGATHSTCEWLRDNIDDPKLEVVYGNHDIHYPYPWDKLISPGFTNTKRQVLQQYLTYENCWSKFKLFIWVEDYLCSHAGIHPNLLHPVYGFEQHALEELEANALSLVQYGSIAPLLAAGRGRGGYAPVGGVTWLDWASEFVPIDGLNQIVGHSFHKDPRTRFTESSKNWCIDTNLNHVILIENNEVVVETLPKKV